MSEMREALNAAMDATKAADDSQNFDETKQEVITDEPREEAGLDKSSEAVSSDSGSADGDGVGKPEAKKEGEKTDLEVDKTPLEASKVGVDADKALLEEGEKGGGSNDSIKAPVDWGPKERESWSKIPRNLQEKVMAREKQIGELMQGTAEARKTHEAFSQLTQRYGAVLSGIAGNTPVEQAGNLFNTVANLRMGSPIQKAQIMADMIKDFGVDINTLDSAIVGQAPPPEQQESTRIEQLVAERLAPFEQMMGQQNAYKQQQATQVQEAANVEVQTFAKTAEFMNDVRLDMADLLDLADKRGYQMSIQEAYDKACALKPDIQAVLTERKQREDLLKSGSDLADKRRAASSVSGRQTGSGGSSGSMSIRDTLTEAWDSQGKV